MVTKNGTFLVRRDITENWDRAAGFVPKSGEVIVYLDYKTIEKDGKNVFVPGVKIGNGNAYVQDLAFLDEANSQEILEHISNTVVHVTQEERTFWNNKINTTGEIHNEILVFNRN